jgi:hypothetical protein
MPNFKASQTLPFSRRTLLAGLTGLCLVARPQPQRQSPLPDAPPPKFWFGDHVVWSIWCDHPDDPTYEIEFFYHGTIVGLAYGKNGLYYKPTYECWWYLIDLDLEPGEALTNPKLPEHDLESEDLLRHRVPW